MKTTKYITIAIVLFALALPLAVFRPHAKAAGNVHVSHYGYYEPIAQNYWVFGEFQNIGDTPVTNITLTVHFYDASNALINSSYTYILPGIGGGLNPWVLMPSSKAPFWPVILGKSSGSNVVDHYTATATFQECTAIPAGLQLTLSVGEISPDAISVTGTVKNTGTSSANFVFLYVTGYDSNGVAIGYGTDETDNLGSGQVWQFSMQAAKWYFVTPSKDYVSYTITAQSFALGDIIHTPLYIAQYATTDISGGIPEFPSALGIILLMMTMTAALIFYRKRQF